MEIITTTFFVAFVDEFSIALEEIDDPLISFTVELKGTKDQIAGFICLFHAQYGGGGLSTVSMRNNRHLWEQHYHFDEHTEEVVSRNHRYIVEFESLLEFGCIFTTNDLSQFLSGMLSVPNTIPFEIPNIGFITVSLQNWIGDAVYFDFTVDDQRDDFINERNNNAVPLSNYIPETVKPMTVNFIKN